MNGGLPVARVLGIEVRLHLSWVFIIAIITVTVGTRLEAMPGGPGTVAAWIVGAVASIGFMVTVIGHELAHAIVGRRAGIPSDSVSVHFIGSPAAVDVRASTARDEAAVALAGPITSFLIGSGLLILAMGLLGIGGNVAPIEVLADVLLVVGILNFVLAGLSIVPAFPLDGGRVVRAIAWARTGDELRGTRAAAIVGRAVGWLFLGIGLGVILLGNTLDGIMLGLVGWFLGASARSVDRWLVLDGLMRGVRVDEAMEPDTDTITPQLTLDTFGDQVLNGTLGPAVAVLHQDALVGMVGLVQLRGVPRRDWPSTRTMDVMVDVADLPTIRPEATLTEALDRLRATRLDGLPVLDASGLKGLLTRRSIAVALRAKADVQGVRL